MENKLFVSWSGGKDSYLSLLKAREAGLKISTLVTFFKENDLSMYHGIKKAVIEKQAAALGLDLELEPVSEMDNGEALLHVMERLRQKGINGGVFGDINLLSHRKWVEKICRRGGMTMYMPLWGMEENEILAQLRDRGCRLLIVAVRRDLIDKKWLGREIDDEFIQMCKQSGISVCGERGEFHTLAIDGPLFQKPLLVVPQRTFRIRGYSHLLFNIKGK